MLFQMVHIYVSISQPALSPRHSRNTRPITYPRRLPEGSFQVTELLRMFLYLRFFSDEGGRRQHSSKITDSPPAGIPASWVVCVTGNLV